MVNAPVTGPREAERALAIGYAPAVARPALAALLALDTRLGDLVAAAREPMVAQMRLTWWHEALCRLDAAPPPAEPLLSELAREVLPRGVSGAGLAAMIDGWERLLDEAVDDEALAAFALHRGAALFAIGAHLLGGVQPDLAHAGEGWALADLAARISDRQVAAGAAALAAQRLADVTAERWPRSLRALGALALLARADLAGVSPGSPRRVARLLRHRLTGR
jgi:phytoene synthase